MSPTDEKGLAPLRLGTKEETTLEAREEYLGLKAVVVLPTMHGEPGVHLSKRGASALADWLHLFAHPRPKLQLWGVDGIAKECSVSRGTVYNWAARPDFPQPIPVVGGNGQVWEARAVKAWVRLAKRPGGRPRKQKAPGR